MQGETGNFSIWVYLSIFWVAGWFEIDITKFDKPIEKSILEIEYGDIFKIELGDYDNWVELIYENYEPINDGLIKIYYHTIRTQEKGVCYSFGSLNKLKFIITGKEKETENEQIWKSKL